MPGIVDAHVHVKAHLPVPDPGAEPLLPGVADHFVAASLAAMLRMGITTVRDVGLLRRRGRRGAPGDALRRVPRPAPADLRADRVGDRARRALLRRHVPRGRRVRRRPPRGARAAAPRRRLRQGDDDRRALRRARGPRPRPAHRRRRSRRSSRRPTAWATGWRRTRRASPGPRSRSSTASTRSSTGCTCTSVRSCSPAWPRPGQVLVPDALLLLRRRRRRGPAGEPARGDLVAAARRARRVQPRAGRPDAARRQRRRRPHRDGLRLGAARGERDRARAHGPARAHRPRGAHRGHGHRRGRARSRARTSGPSSRASSPTSSWSTATPSRTSPCCWTRDRIWLVLQLGEPVAGAALEREAPPG